MLKDFEESLQDVINIQCSNGNWNYDPYMHGLANGLLMAQALYKGKEPQFLDGPDKWLKNYPSIWTKIKWKLFPSSMVSSALSEAELNPR